MFKNKVVLVTGGAGFIGSHIAEKVLELNAEKVIILDNLVFGSISKIQHIMNDARVEFIKDDVTNNDLIKSLVEKSDYVFHEAASKFVFCLKNPRIDLNTNIIGTFNILEAAQNSDLRIIHGSTGSVLGSSDKPMTEDDPRKPTSLYGISKSTGEMYCSYYAKEKGVKVSMLRYFHVFGPRQDYDGEAGVISIFLGRVLQKKPPIIFGSGEQIRCFTYVSDDVEANLLLAKNNSTIGKIYNVASKTRMTINELASTIIKKYGPKGMKPEYAHPRKGENMKPIPDTSKIEKIGFKESVSFEEGLEKTKKWVEEDMKNG